MGGPHFFPPLIENSPPNLTTLKNDHKAHEFEANYCKNLVKKQFTSCTMYNESSLQVFWRSRCAFLEDFQGGQRRSSEKLTISFGFAVQTLTLGAFKHASALRFTNHQIISVYLSYRNEFEHEILLKDSERQQYGISFRTFAVDTFGMLNVDLNYRFGLGFSPPNKFSNVEKGKPRNV